MRNEEVFTLEKIMQYMRWEQGLKSALYNVCPRCKGRGKFYAYSTITGELNPYECQTCKGKGIIEE